MCALRLEAIRVADITVQQLSQAILETAAGVKKYRLGGSGADGTCDCIGLIIGALKRCGYKWPGTHGTNWAARNAVQRVAQLEPGAVVFKYRSRNDSGYDLPDRYKSGSDLLDYYHVGYVLSVEPLEIIHCTSPGPIKRDTVIGKWRAFGKLKMVDYTVEKTEGKTMNKIMTVRSSNGLGANLRKKPDRFTTLVEKIPEGASVELVATCGPDWSLVVYGNKSGYVMTQYLADPGDDPEDPTETMSTDAPSSELITLKLHRSTAEYLFAILNTALIGDADGVG